MKAIEWRHKLAYHNAIDHARYYVWAALRGIAMAGNDPITGRSRSGYYVGYRRHRDEARAAYKAQARDWLGVARTIRVGGA